MALAPPVRKKFRGMLPDQGDPLPIPIATYTGFPSSSTSWNYFRGVYKGGVVIVDDLNHIASLWHNGYFGQLKNTDLHSEDFVSEESYNHKTWKLLETDGIKDMSILKKPMELGDNGDQEISEESATLDSKSDDINEESGRADFKARGKAMDSFEVSQDEDSVQEVKNDNNEDKYSSCEKKDVGTDESDAITPKQDAERCKQAIKEDCRTILTFESDFIPSVFFDDENVDTSKGHLELLPEEAMFLTYALGCLIVEKEWEQSKAHQFKGKQKSCANELTIDHLWGEFVSDDPKFVARYAVYHHYRAKGWVVRSGLKFGADYLLYKDGPPFYHAQFTVMIQCIWSDTNERDESLSSREMSWLNFSVVQRLNNHVKKTPLISYVLRPRSLTAHGLYKVSCLKSLTVKEIVLSRWDPTAVVDPEEEITLD